MACHVPTNPFSPIMVQNLRPHLQVYGFFGAPDQLGITRNFAANEALNAARARSGGAPGLCVVGEKPVEKLKAGMLGSKAPSDGSRQTDETRRAPVVLARRATYASAQNQKSAWSAAQVGADADWEQLANPFGGSVGGLFYSNANPLARCLFSGPQIGANSSIALRLYRFHGDYKDTKETGGIYWGNAGGVPQWRLQFHDGQFALQRLSANWTQGAQYALETLLSLPTPTPAQEAQIETSRQSLFVSETPLSTSGETWARTIEIWIECDDCGSVWVQIGREGEQVVELPDVLSSRKTGTLWNAGPIQIGTNQGAFMWQLGTLTTSSRARFYLPWVARGPNAIGGTASAAYYAPPGTSVTWGIDSSDVWDQVWFEMASDGSRTPVLHDCFYTVPGGVRPTGSPIQFDSDTVSLGGAVPIGSVSLSWSGQGKRLALDVEVLSPGGQILVSAGTKLELWAERIAQLYLGNGSGESLLCKGLVQSPTLSELTNAAQGIALSQIAGGQTSLKFKLVDFWQIADEWLLRETPVGDDQVLGDYLTLLLTFAGFTDAELSGVKGIGPTLPKAAPGEKPLLVPDYEAPTGDFLRHLMDEYASGYTLDCYTGVWRLRARNFSPRCAFGTAKTDTSGLPTFPILEPLDLIRDHKKVKTHFCGQGAASTPGSAPVEWGVNELVDARFQLNQAGFQGRIKRAKTQQNDAWRTRDETTRGTRAKVRREARPGRYFGFVTRFCVHLLGGDLLAPGDYVLVSGTTVDGTALAGVLCEIMSLNGGSIETGNDSLSVSVREVILFA